jgi:hexosaminidase
MSRTLNTLKAGLITCPFCLSLHAADCPVIPRPVHYESRSGMFCLNEKTTITTDAGLKAKALQLQRYLQPATGYSFGLQDAASTNCIILKQDASLKALGDEGYTLVVTPERIVITARAAHGVFYGIQTLRQLLPPAVFSSTTITGTVWTVPCVKIEDYPRFGWRGLHLDVSRHFFDADFIKKYIDMLALHKMNIYHWHLCDDQGWRMEVKKYPKLTEIGAWRTDNNKKGEWNYHAFQYPGKQSGRDLYGGYYTQEQIKDIVQYAAERHIDILPEIEMPGHSMVALLAYPEYTCTNKPSEKSRYGHPNVYCAGNDAVFTFLQDILDETMELFPFEYIHVGGDEVNKYYWERCPRCKTRMKSEKLKDAHELQSYFMKRMEKYLTSKGKRLIGWDEILEGGLPPKATVMSWRGTAGGIKAARSGHDVVIAPYYPLYFDALQDDAQYEPKTIGYAPNPISRVYFFEPIPQQLSEKEADHVLGCQGQAWTEWMFDQDRVEYMVYPRACALSEIAWTPPEQKDFADFFARLIHHVERLKLADVNFRPLDAIIGIWSPDMVRKEMILPLGDAGIEPGYYLVEFRHITGSSVLNIESVSFMDGNRRISIDSHPGCAGSNPIGQHYVLDLTGIASQENTRITVQLKNEGPANSYGEILLRKIPEQEYKIMTAPPVVRKLQDGWKSGETSTAYRPLLYDVTGSITKKGSYDITFEYTGGAHRLDIAWVEILAGNTVISRDEHFGFTGAGKKDNVYRLDVPEIKPDTKYILKVLARSDGGMDSNGKITIKKR